MDIKELTIGSTVKNQSGNEVIVSSISETRINEIYSLDQIEGIDLTTEYLEDSGFEFSFDGTDDPEYRMDCEGTSVIVNAPVDNEFPGWTLYIIDKDTGLYLSGTSTIKYVHQLEAFLKINKK